MLAIIGIGIGCGLLFAVPMTKMLVDLKHTAS